MPTGITGLTNIGNGLAANDGTGDTLRTGADKINANNAAIMAAVNDQAVLVEAIQTSFERVPVNAVGPHQLDITDADGYIKSYIDADGAIETDTLSLRDNRLRFGELSVSEASTLAVDTGFGVMDVDGFYVELVYPDGSTSSSGAPGVVDDAALYAARNASNLAASANAKTSMNTVTASFSWDYNHVVMYGQSLSNGWEGWPALSKTSQYASNVMIGGSVRPTGEFVATFDPVGGSSAFQPMIAVTQDASTGAVMSDADVAALAPGAPNRGECAVIGAVNFAKRMHNLRAGLLDDESRVYVASAPGVGGQIIENLMKGASTGYWGRVTSVVAQAQANATTAGKSYGVPAFLWAQGEQNYSTGDTSLAGYKAKLGTLWSDFKADCAAAQQQPPAFITYQTGASFTSDANGLAIGMAQWEFCQENSGCYMATPIYPFTDKNGHLDPNGYRWFGNQLGKVLHRVVEMREDWKPLSPRSVRTSGALVSIDFHVPDPPLVFSDPYVVNTATDYADKGFSVIDADGAVPVSSVRIVFDTIVELTCSRNLVAPVTVRYADKTTHNGNGCLRDSDATVANDTYVYNAGTGQYASANIAELVGKPYPLWNWCIAFSLTASED